MMALDPRDFRPFRDYLSHVRYDLSEQWKSVREKTIADAKSDPRDPVKLLAASVALRGKDTPQAFQLAEQAISVAPGYAPAYVHLSRLYDSSGKYTDRDKAAKYLRNYYELCPSGEDERAVWYLNKLGSNDLKLKVANSLRTRLANTTDVWVLMKYSAVWSLEFAVTPITEHTKERQRVAEDLKHLQSLPVEASAEWLGFLRDGYKQASTFEEQVKAIEARITKDYPTSDEAFSIWYGNWKDQHPQPEGDASADQWQQYLRTVLAHTQESARLFPKSHGSGYLVFEYTSYLNGASSADIAGAAQTYLKDSAFFAPATATPQYIATVFLDHNIEPNRALALLEEVRRMKDSPREKMMAEMPDYAKPKDIEEAAQEKALSTAEFDALYMRACRAAGAKAEAEQLKAQVEAAPPAYPKALPDYWQARAVLAEIEARNTDALAYYQKALFLREPPQKVYGVLNDPLLSDAKRVWRESHGSESAFAIWSQPDTSTRPALAEGRWEKPDKDLPVFELADLQGKTWKLKRLEGKNVLINIWATWCGPCQAELPHLEKLYEQTKNRTDIQILTLNFDEDLGLVEPFVKKKGFTFPVLPAYAFLANKIDVNSIPRNWLVNANGKWQWEQIGFYSGEADWEKHMLERLQATR